jgi:hypothetical protein
MTSKGPFNENNEDMLKTISTSFIGELITMFVGEDELQKRFENNPEFQEKDFGDKPSGIIAVDLGIITNNQKQALLAAQAGARAVCVAMGYEDQKPANDKVFRFVGTDNNPLLDEAQGNWQIAHIIDHDDQTIAAFKHFASKHMAEAAKTLEKDFPDAAQKVKAVAQSIFVKADAFEKAPSELINDHLVQYTLDNPGKHVNGEYVVSDAVTAMQETLQNLRDISSRGAGVPKGYVPARQGPTKP